MPLEMRKTSQWWYGRYNVGNKIHCVNLRVKIEGKRPCDSDTGEGAAGHLAAGGSAAGVVPPCYAWMARRLCAGGAVDGARAQDAMRGKPPWLWQITRQVRRLWSWAVHEGQTHFLFLLPDQTPEFFTGLFRYR